MAIASEQDRQKTALMNGSATQRYCRHKIFNIIFYWVTTGTALSGRDTKNRNNFGHYSTHSTYN